MRKNQRVLELSDKIEIKSVADYIEKIEEYIEENVNNGWLCVYRGESDVYDKPCRPNIFRKGLIDLNKFFEKNLFSAMRQNQLTGDKCYLDNAIDAQHGEFPSRLLDVTYNCLTALYFAVTPYYHKAEDSLDEKDGMVYMIFVDDIFSPSAQNTNDAYNTIINRDKEWFTNRILFAKNHKFIDHSKLNSRIVAQQGAFILFQGDDASDLPAYMVYGIRIPHEAKKKIRRELKVLFGIHTGSIYPEIVNLVKEISEKSQRLNTQKFGYKEEIDYTLKVLEHELSFYTDYLIDCKKKLKNDMCDEIIAVENIIKSYRDGFLDFIEYFKVELQKRDSEDKKEGQDYVYAIIDRYNTLLDHFHEEIKRNRILSISRDELQIKR